MMNNPGGRQLSDDQWFGTFTAAENIVYEEHGRKSDGKPVHLNTHPVPKVIEKGTQFSILRKTSDHVFILIGDETIIVTRQAIAEMIVH